MAHIPLAAGALGTKTVGSRRRQGAVVPIGTKKVVEYVGRGTCGRAWRPVLRQPIEHYLICKVFAQSLMPELVQLRVFAFFLGGHFDFIDHAANAADAVDGVDDWATLIFRGNETAQRHLTARYHRLDLATATATFLSQLHRHATTELVIWHIGTHRRSSERTLERTLRRAEPPLCLPADEITRADFKKARLRRYDFNRFSSRTLWASSLCVINNRSLAERLDGHTLKSGRVKEDFAAVGLDEAEAFVSDNFFYCSLRHNRIPASERCRSENQPQAKVASANRCATRSGDPKSESMNKLRSAVILTCFTAE